MELSSRPTPVVLVADDEPTMLALVSRHVRALGYDVLEASEGETAWHHAAKNLPDLVILDVMMPGMSGWEVCRRVREHVALAHTGVIMLTGIGESLNELTSPLYGADAYIDKPFEFKELDDKIYTVLKARGHAAITIEPPPPSGVDLGDGESPEQAHGHRAQRSVLVGGLDAVVHDEDDGEDNEDEASLALTLRAPPKGKYSMPKISQPKAPVDLVQATPSKSAAKASKSQPKKAAKASKPSTSKPTKSAKTSKAAKASKASKAAKPTKVTKSTKKTAPAKSNTDAKKKAAKKAASEAARPAAAKKSAAPKKPAKAAKPGAASKASKSKKTVGSSKAPAKAAASKGARKK